jgi:PAS domain S-box-containing protein
LPSCGSSAKEEHVEETQEQSNRRPAGPPPAPAVPLTEAQIADILECIGDGVYAVDADWRIIYVNRKLEELLGRGRDDLLGKNAWQEFLNAVGSPVDDMLLGAMQERGTVAIEYLSPTLNRWIDLSVYPIGTGLLFHFGDITECKQAEIERERLVKELDESRHLFQQIAETSPDSLFVYDFATEQNIFVSARSEQMIGYTADEVTELGDRFAATLWHPEDSPGLPEHRRRLRELADDEINETEYRVRQPDGTYRWLRSRTRVFARDADGQVRQIMGVAQDVTERKRADDELLALKNRLAADLSAMTRLHELSARLLAPSKLQPLLEDALAATITLQGADFGNIQLYNRQTGALEIVVQQGFDQAFLDYFSVVDDEHAACGRAAIRGERVIIEDVETDAGFAPHREIAAATGFRTVQSTPLVDRAGELLGMFSTHFRQLHRFTEHELRLTDLYTRQVAEMIGFKLAEQKLSLTHEQLEARVVERTLELSETNAALRVEVAERERAEGERRRLALLVENSSDFIGLASLDGRVLFVNPAGQKLLGISGDEQVRTTTILDYIADSEKVRFQHQVWPHIFETGRWEGEMIFTHFVTGAPVPMWQHIFFVTEQESQQRIGLATISRDITERRRAAETRQHLLEQIVNAQEDERRRISRELHDTLGQHLTALHLGLKSVQDQIGSAFVRSRIRQLRELAMRFDDVIDHLAFELRPPALDDLGLEAALRLLIKEWSATSGVPIDVHTSRIDHQRLPTALETTLYRVVQEALTNILKHAYAARVSLIIDRRNGEVVAIVEDDGCGFDLKRATTAPGAQRKLGITGMEERVALVGGRLTIESAPGDGTTVYVHIPLPAGDPPA